MLQNHRNALQDTWCKMRDTLNTDPAFLQMIKLTLFIYIMVEGKWAIFTDGEVSKLRIS